MEIKLSESHQFSVKQVANEKLNKCTVCEGVGDIVFYPCLHNTLCSECQDSKLKKCPVCTKEIKSFDVYYDLIG